MIFSAFLLVFLSFGRNSRAGSQCSELGDDSWQQCECLTVGSQGNSLHVVCHHLTSATVPILVQRPSTGQNDIVAITLTDGALAFIQQDAFKHHNVQSLDFQNNYVQTINVNAFRGIENKLVQLNLRSNNLSVIPTWAFTYLHLLQSLRLENNRISSIRSNAFEETQLHSLQFLHLDSNQISLIPTMAFHRLRLIVLTLANNRIQAIEKLALPTTLNFLDLSGNLFAKVPYLAFKELANLQTLNLEGNRISLLHYEPDVTFKNEMKLALRNNKVKALEEHSFRSFRKFSELDISYNQISHVHQSAFSTIASLKSLDLSYNSITVLHFGTFKNFAKNLERLNLEENNFHTLPETLRDLQALTHLNLNGNKLSSLSSDCMSGFKSTLTELYLAYNHLKEVPISILHKMNNLRHLDISKNRISVLETESVSEFDMEDSAGSLVLLNLAGNLISNVSHTTFFRSLYNLVYLDLSYNQIVDVGRQAFDRLNKLEKVFLQGNNLKDFPISFLPFNNKLRHLVLDGNDIETLPDYFLETFGNLEHLSLARNRIKKINSRTFHSSSCRNMTSLVLDDNHIGKIDSETFSGLENLQYLRIRNNRIVEISSRAFTNLKRLKYLDLSGNQIVRLRPNTFDQLPALETLILSHNQIHGLDTNALSEIRRLESLDLSHNQMKEFSCNSLGTLNTLHSLILTNNIIMSVDLTCVKRTLKQLDLGDNRMTMIRKDTMENFDELSHVSFRKNGLLEIQSHTFHSCPKLKHIDLSLNHIKSVWRNTFDRQEMIWRIDLSENALISVQRGCFGKDNLLSLNLAENELQRVPIEALGTVSASLSTLDLCRNRLKTIDAPQFVGLRNISWLSLSKNLIESVEEAAFEHLTNLRHLELDLNPVSSWSPTAFRDISHSITTLNIASTGLFSMPKLSHRGIRHLNISWNAINNVAIEDVEPLSKLTSFDISFNNIREIRPQIFEHLVDLKHLNISGNPIEYIRQDYFSNMYQLESLHMAKLHFLQSTPEIVVFSNLTNLKNLQIYDLPPSVGALNIRSLLSQLPLLKSLHIEIQDEILDNQLQNADKRHWRELVIEGKRLKQITAGALAGLRGFRFHLTIQNTSIEEIPPEMFNTWTGVNFLSLSLPYNRLRKFNPFQLRHAKPPVINQHGTILSSIDLQGNPLACDCAYEWVGEWLSLMPDQKKKFSHIKCETGRNLLKSMEDCQSRSSFNGIPSILTSLPIVILVFL